MIPERYTDEEYWAVHRAPADDSPWVCAWTGVDLDEDECDCPFAPCGWCGGKVAGFILDDGCHCEQRAHDASMALENELRLGDKMRASLFFAELGALMERWGVPLGRRLRALVVMQEAHERRQGREG
jgi:hypothetical protein